jgi:flagellar biosynthetic protein FliR
MNDPFHFFVWLLVFLRVSALLTVFPVFSMSHMPVQLRVALGVLTAVLIAPFVSPPATAPNSIFDVFGLMVLEVCVGLLLGFISRLVFFALDVAGGLIAAETGLMFTPDPDPFTATETQAPGLVLYLLAIMLIFGMDLHHWLLMAIQRSFGLVPIGGMHLHPGLLSAVIQRTSSTFLIAVQITAPIIAVSFIITLTFSILGRAVPNINVFSESFSVRSLVGIALLGLSLQLMAHQILAFLRQLPDDLLRVAQLLGSA